MTTTIARRPSETDLTELQRELAEAEAALEAERAYVAKLEERQRRYQRPHVLRGELQARGLVEPEIQNAIDESERAVRSLPADLRHAREDLARAERRVALCRSQLAAAEAPDPEPELSPFARRGSAALRAELAEIDERQQRRREALADAEKELKVARGALRELQVSRELDGVKPPAGAVAKAEARVSECEREISAKRAALEVETERTEPRRAELEAALAEAVAAEEEAARAAAERERSEELAALRRRTIRALAELLAALKAEGDAGPDLFDPRTFVRAIEQLSDDQVTKNAGLRVHLVRGERWWDRELAVDEGAAS